MGAVVHVGQGKDGGALKDFWTRLRRSRAKIEAVAADMSPAYMAAVMTHLPEATLVFDRFHVIKLLQRQAFRLRRELYRTATEGLEKKALKGSRWLLLKRPENLDASRNRARTPQEALRLNEPLAMAYYLKEELNEIWEQDDERAAEALMMDWITYAESSGIRMLQQFARNSSLSREGNFGLL